MLKELFGNSLRLPGPLCRILKYIQHWPNSGDIKVSSKTCLTSLENKLDKREIVSWIFPCRSSTLHTIFQGRYITSNHRNVFRLVSGRVGNTPAKSRSSSGNIQITLKLMFKPNLFLKESSGGESYSVSRINRYQHSIRTSPMKRFPSS